MGPDWFDETAEDFFKGKRVLVVSLPGAFTATCSKFHLPGYVKNAQQILDKGIDKIFCLALNDTYVMNEWG